MDEKATMGQSLRSTEDEETIDLMELARLLWAVSYTHLRAHET